MAAKDIVRQHYENTLATHGATVRGMDWEGGDPLVQRFHVMAELFSAALAGATNGSRLKILDLGCGAGFFYDYLRLGGLIDRVDYTGIDISQGMVAAARHRHPGAAFEVRDVLEKPIEPVSYDFVVMNGILTVKASAGQDDMIGFAQALMMGAFAACRGGIAVNMMTKHVDWEKDRLFHYPLDAAQSFFKQHLSRHTVFRHDYGLWEYTAYIYREPQRRRHAEIDAHLAALIMMQGGN